MDRMLWVRLLAVCFCLSAVHLQSQGGPTATPLRAYRDGLRAPARIATDGSGNVYIVDHGAGQVIVRDEYGRLKTTLSGFVRPLGIAVDASGRIFVGEEGTGSVSILLPDGSRFAKLGIGDGEFRMPNHLAIAPDATGLVYVADSEAHVVKVFRPDGTAVRSFGSKGSFDGQFDFPAGLAVSGGGEVFVADQNNGRVQVFSAEGQYLRSFGRSRGGMGMGGGSIFGRIQGLMLDAQGRLFVADTFQGQVRVFDGVGKVLSTIGSFGEGLGQMRAPTSLALDRNNRLFVVSPGNTRVELFGLDAYVDPKILVGEASLRPTAFKRKKQEGDDSKGHGGEKKKKEEGHSKVQGFLKVPGVEPQELLVASICANGVVAEAFPGEPIGDFDDDGLPELRVWFDRSALVATLPDGPGIVLLTGRLVGGMAFEAQVSVRVKGRDQDHEKDEEEDEEPQPEATRSESSLNHRRGAR